MGETARNGICYRNIGIADETLANVQWFVFGAQAMKMPDQFPQGTVVRIPGARVEANYGRILRLTSCESSGEATVWRVDSPPSDAPTGELGERVKDLQSWSMGRDRIAHRG